MECDLYVGKVVDEPDTWVLGTIKRVNTKFAVIQQRCEYPFAKCCGVGDFEVYTDSLIKVPIGEIEIERTSLSKQLDEMTDMYIQVCKAFGVEIMQLKKELSVYVKALQLACEALSDAKDMFFSIKQDQLGHWIDDGESYYLTKAKGEIENDS